MGICISPPLSSVQSKSGAGSEYGQFCKAGNIDELVEKLRREEFNRVIDKLYAHYDSNSDGSLEYEEVKRLLADVLGRKSVSNDDAEVVLRLCKSEDSKTILK
jgi:Ca2+-binding EF-hand superfamily protein